MTKIINWKTKEVIIEDNDLSIKELVEKAVKDKISLAYANLRGACLFEADLRKANLKEANLKDVNLIYADLCGADLYEANMRDADLYGAFLGGADISGIKINQDQKDNLLKALGIKIYKSRSKR